MSKEIREKSHSNEVDLVLSVLEAHKMARMSRTAFYEAVKRKDILSIRIGKKILIPRKQFLDFLSGLSPKESA